MKKIFLITFVLCSLNAFSQWQQVGNGLNSDVNVLLADSANGILYAGGDFTYSQNTYCPFIAKWDGISWQPMGNGFNGSVNSLCFFRDTLYAGGSFTASGGTTVKNIAKWDGQNWLPVINNINGDVLSMCVFQNELYIGGYFDKAGNTTVNSIIKYDGQQWSNVGLGVTDGGYVAYVHAMYVYKNQLYFGGNFNRIGSSSTMSINNAPYVLKWDGFTLQTLSNLGEASITYKFIEHQSILVIGGDSGGEVEFYDGSTYLNHTTKLPVNSVVNNAVVGLAVYDNKLIIGGGVTLLYQWPNMQPCWYLSAATDGTNWYILECNVSDHIWEYKVFQNELYMGGKFVGAGNTTVNHIAKWSGAITSIYTNIDDVTSNDEGQNVFYNRDSRKITLNIFMQSCSLQLFNSIGQIVAEIQLSNEREYSISKVPDNNLLYYKISNGGSEYKVGRVSFVE